MATQRNKFVVDLSNPQVADAHNLMPKALEEQMPGLYATEGNPEALCLIKLFTPDAQWTWYLIEYDASIQEAFGFEIGDGGSGLTYIDLPSVRKTRGPLGLRVERDLSWKPTPISKVKSGKVR